MKLPTYQEWATDFDDTGKGLGWTVDEERGEWLVAPVILTRDSGALERSNWETVAGELELGRPEWADDVEALDFFNHWACGWFRVLIVRPDSEAAALALEWAESLSDYGVADEEHLAQVQAEEEAENWESYGRADWRGALGRRFPSLDWDDVGDAAADDLFSDAGGDCWPESQSTFFDIERAAARVTLAQALAAGAREVQP